MIDHIGNRQKILKLLEQELFGPAPTGDDRDCSLPLVFDTTESAYGPFKEKSTGEEIINRDSPSRRYGIGVLFPSGTQEPLVDESSSEESLAGEQARLNPVIEINGIEPIQEMLTSIRQDENPSDYDLSLANSYRQSSIGISFLAEIKTNSVLEISLTAGRYSQLPVMVNGKDKVWWLRKPVTLLTRIPANELVSKPKVIVRPAEIEGLNTEKLKLQFVVLSRSYKNSDILRLITISLVNRTDETDLSQDEKCIFQTRFKAKVISPESEWNIVPYPGRINVNEAYDNEELSLKLLYRHHPTFCTGHGCAGDWEDLEDERAKTVIADPLPKFEVPSVTSEILNEKGVTFKIPMAPLAGLVAEDNGLNSLITLIVMYENWIEKKRGDLAALPSHLQHIAQMHLEVCENCAKRMRAGLEFIKTNERAAFAFQLANRAILYQQTQPKEKRGVFYDKKSKRIGFLTAARLGTDEKEKNPSEWRAFQIAFLLMAIESTARGNSLEREFVELIWFPTGGGKTEAYLGLAAFSIFLRRLENPEDYGVNVLMRYTLRLLTSQQFLRASKLILAMEAIRREFPKELGEHHFSIGMWVGAANTPNKREEAIKIFNDLEKGNASVENKFVLDRCPWCGAEMGPIKHKIKSSGYFPKLLGLQKIGNTVKFHCPDHECIFASGLPIHVVDEDIFSEKPSIVIGTVDKFATLAWNPSARAIFGIGQDGRRICSPPALIIQDELHLISGPLGSMVGLYEVIVEELSTDRRNGNVIKPKIVSSTATIRRYREQILALYGRQSVMLFPPPGLEAADSFFATHAIDKNTKPLPGRLYVGIHAPGLGSLQTAQVRTFTSLIHAPMHLKEAERDPWWTLLVFFNSLRELGTTLSLLQADIPDYTKVLVNRYRSSENLWRGVWEVKELTGRARSEDIPKAISELERTYPSKESRPIDVCLASNILEVGVDIDRLSLMSVVGQPKTTSQYIQVTGRVGRSWWERPGMVVTIYSASKPRDRSHFEKFRTYHERLYEQVEPASVTPFSPPALERALHAVLVSYVRQIGDQSVANSPYPFPEKLIDDIKGILIPRIRKIDALELDNFERVFSRLSKEWKSWQMVRWEQSWNSDDLPLLRRAGDYVPPDKKSLSWETPTSLRNVDAECIAEISHPLPVQDSGDAK